METIKLDIAYIDKIHALCLEQFKQEAWSIEQIRESFHNVSTSFYGIVDNQELLCFASIIESVDDINLLDIATKEEYKHHGLAKQLLNYLLSLKNSEQSFSLEVKSTNQAAINLYLQFGFKTLAVRKKYYKDGDDALCMFLN